MASTEKKRKMTEREERARKRAGRIEEAGDDAAHWARIALFAVGGVLLAIAAFFGGITPFVLAWASHGLGLVLSAIGGGLLAFGGLLHHKSETHGQKLAWAVVAALGLLALLLLFGVI
jgi:hypothetical protein